MAMAIKAKSVLVPIDKLFLSQNDHERKQEIYTAISSNIKHNPPATIRLIQKIDQVSHREECYKVALRLWYANDTEGFITWLNKYRSTLDELDNALIYLLTHVEKPNQAIIIASNISQVTPRNSEMTRIIKSWTHVNSVEAINWANSHRDNQWLYLAYNTLLNLSAKHAINALPLLSNASSQRVTSIINILASSLSSTTLNEPALNAITHLRPYPIREQFISTLLPKLVTTPSSSLHSVHTLISSLSAGQQQQKMQRLISYHLRVKHQKAAQLSGSHHSGKRHFAAQATPNTRSTSAH